MSLLKTNNPLALRLLMTDDLYLIDEREKEAPAIIETVPVESSVFNYTGENNKYILIVINDPIHTSIKPADLETLTSILTAKNLELRDVAVFNLARHADANFKQLKEFFSCSKLILLGVNPKQIGLPDISSNEIKVFDNTKILASYNISEMMQDVAKKRLFWSEMKKL